jgi:hypothetical protein
MITLRRLYRGSDDDLDDELGAYEEARQLGAYEEARQPDPIKNLTSSLETVSLRSPNASSSKPTTETRAPDPKASSSNSAYPLLTALEEEDRSRSREGDRSRLREGDRSRSREGDRSRSRERDRSRSPKSNNFRLISSPNVAGLHTITRPSTDTRQPFHERPSPRRL